MTEKTHDAGNSAGADSIEQVAAQAQRVIGEVERAIVGKRSALEMTMAAFLARRPCAAGRLPRAGQNADREQLRHRAGHDVQAHPVHAGPAARRYHRRLHLRPRAGQFFLRKGPIFANIILADEINRASPRTQSALLEAMQEYQVTIEGETHALPEPFIVIATQNPIEYEGTFPLPEAQLDRFIMKLVGGVSLRRG